MEYFTSDGTFWLPDQPGRVLPGKLTVNEDGITLELAGSLREPVKPKNGVIEGSPEWATEGIVHGRLLDDREVTLFQVSGLSMPVPRVRETWFATFVLTGGLIGEDSFSQVLVVFDYLMPWVQPPGIMGGEIGVDSFTARTQRVTLAETTLDDGTLVRLIAGVAGQWGDTSIHLDQWCAFEVTGGPAAITEILNRWIGPLQDLLIVCLGRAVRLEELHLRSPDQDPRASMLELSFTAVQPPPGSRPKVSRVDNYDAPTLLTYAKSPLSFEAFIGGWFRLRARLSEAVTLFCGPYYAPFIYSQHRYASTFQSAEALAHKTLTTREKTPSQHRARVKAVRLALLVAQLEEQLDSEAVAWATRLISRNDKPLRQLMQELISSTGEIGRLLVAAAPNLAESVATARTNVSHPGAKGPATLRRYWLGESLGWVIRVRLLAELGIPVDELSKNVLQKPSFQQLLHELPIVASS